MYEMGLRRMLNDATRSGNPQLIERIRKLFPEGDWEIIQRRYAWWVTGVLHLMERESCASLEVMTEQLQDKILNATSAEEVMDIRLLFNGEQWLSIKARFCWWMLGVEKFWSEIREYQ